MQPQRNKTQTVEMYLEQINRLAEDVSKSGLDPADVVAWERDNIIGEPHASQNWVRVLHLLINRKGYPL